MQLQALKLQQTHQETMQNLEDEALEKHACQSFLWACGVALQACPSEALGKLMYPIHLLTGNMSLTSPLTATSPLIIKLQDPIPSHCCPRGLQLLHALLGLSSNTCLDVRWNQIIPEMENLHPYPRELPQWRQRQGRPSGRAFGGHPLGGLSRRFRLG